MDPYWLRSEDHRFTIAKVFVRGEAFYELWEGNRCVAGRLPSANAAKAIANEFSESA